MGRLPRDNIVDGSIRISSREGVIIDIVQHDEVLTQRIHKLRVGPCIEVTSQIEWLFALGSIATDDVKRAQAVFLSEREVRTAVYVILKLNKQHRPFFFRSWQRYPLHP